MQSNHWRIQTLGCSTGHDEANVAWVLRLCCRRRNYRTRSTYVFHHALTESKTALIATSLAALSTLIREAAEEASLSEDFVKSDISSPSGVAFSGLDTDGYLYNEIQHTYDVKFPADLSIQPRAGDDEVDNFQLLSLPEVLDLFRTKRFMP